MSLPGPDARVVELRVPGLVGISGEQLLDSVAAVTVAGDESGEIIRPADRLRRPAPGPVLQALSRSLPRTVEGYLWHKMTSGGVTKATWALLFPFSLANVAHGMVPPAPENSRPAGALVMLCQGMLRLIGLLLTALFVTQLGAISLDMLAGQCLAVNASCLTEAPDWLRRDELLRTLLGLLPPLVVVAALYRVSRVSWQRTGATTSDRAQAGLPGDVLQPSTGAGVLRGLHTLTALACIALLPLGGAFAPPSGRAAVIVWTVSVVVFALTLLAAALLDDVAARLRAMLPPLVLRLLIAAAAGLVVLAGVVGSPFLRDVPDGNVLSGIDGMVEGLLAALLVACVAFALMLAPLALLARRSWRSLPHRLRPWLGGWAAAPAVALACLIGAGFGAGVAISVRELLGGRDDLALPPSYQSLTLLWGVGIVVTAVLWAGLYWVAIPLRRRLRGVPLIVHMLQSGRDEQRQAAAIWAKAIMERKHLHRLVATVALLLSAGALVLVALRLYERQPPQWLQSFSGLGVLALGLLAAGLLRTVYTAARTPQRSRHLGALADLVFFWPRRAHPIVPPSYALKVVPDLVARAAGHLHEPNTRVVLAGYSHGGLLAVIAAARLTTELSDEERERLGLLTAGTPAQWGYQRAFPALVSPATLAKLYSTLEGRWRGLCRGTDSFGGGVTTWRHQVVAGQLLGIGYLPEGGIGPLPAAVNGVAGSLVLGGDHWLPDPIAPPENGHRWAAGVLRHTDYLADPEWDRAVAMAAGLEAPGAPAKPNGGQPSLFGDLPKLP